MVLYCISPLYLFSCLVNFFLRRFPGTWKFKFPKTSFRFVIKHRKITINKKPITLRRSTNVRFPGWRTFSYRGVRYFTRFTSKGIKIVSVKGKKIITSTVVSRPKRKPATRPKKGKKNPKKGTKTPTTGEKKPKKGKKEPTTGKKQPKTGKNPKKGEKTPTTGEKKPKKGKKHPKTGKKQPEKGKKQPKKGEKKPSEKRPGKPRKRKQLTIFTTYTKSNTFFTVQS